MLLQLKAPLIISVLDLDLMKGEVRLKIIGTEEEINQALFKIEEMIHSTKRLKIPIKGKNIRKLLGERGQGLEKLKRKFNLGKLEFSSIPFFVKLLLTYSQIPLD